MGAILDRLTDLARRCGDLSPIAPQVRDVFLLGNRERAMAGTDAAGRPFAPLARSTLKHRHGSGPPQAPTPSAQIITGCEISVQAGPGRLSITQSWPGVRWVEYAISGTRRMPRRDPTGFRDQDKTKVAALMNDYITR